AFPTFRATERADASRRKEASMRTVRVAVITSVVAAALAWAPTAAHARADTYYEVWCTDADGNLIQAESVDAHAIDQGGKGESILKFSEHNHCGWTCWWEGPFGP